MWCYLVVRHNGQWNIRERWKKKSTRNRYQEQKHNMRTTCVSPTTKINKNRTRGITEIVPKPKLSLVFKGLINSIGPYNRLIL